MKSVISELWNGEIKVCEDIVFKKEFEKEIEEAFIAEREFIKLLNKEQAEAFKEFINKYMYMGGPRDEYIFKKGFSLGVRLIVEAVGKQ
jgi:hypothetical protein